VNVDEERQLVVVQPKVLDPDVALNTIATLKGVLTKGTAAKTLANFPFPAAGKTGTQQDNTNSWFVGASPQLTTAVWVGDPDAYTPMVNVPEFVGVGKVQGATYPARIWGALMEPALAPLPVEDWPAAPPPARKPVRLYLPGNECLAKLVSGVLPTPGGPTTTTATTLPPAAPPEGDPTTTTIAPKPVLKAIPSDTTIPADVLDPKSPLPQIDPKGIVVYPCDKAPKDVVITGKKKATTTTTTG